jgi:hypothetical protein
VEALEGGEELVSVAHVEAGAVVPHHADLFGAGGHALSQLRLPAHRYSRSGLLPRLRPPQGHFELPGENW